MKRDKLCVGACVGVLLLVVVVILLRKLKQDNGDKKRNVMLLAGWLGEASLVKRHWAERVEGSGEAGHRDADGKMIPAEGRAGTKVGPVRLERIEGSANWYKQTGWCCETTQGPVSHSQAIGVYHSWNRQNWRVWSRAMMVYDMSL